MNSVVIIVFIIVVYTSNIIDFCYKISLEMTNGKKLIKCLMFNPFFKNKYTYRMNIDAKVYENHRLT